MQPMFMLLNFIFSAGIDLGRRLDCRDRNYSNWDDIIYWLRLTFRHVGFQFIHDTLTPSFIQLINCMKCECLCFAISTRIEELLTCMKKKMKCQKQQVIDYKYSYIYNNVVDYIYQFFQLFQFSLTSQRLYVSKINAVKNIYFVRE